MIRLKDIKHERPFFVGISAFVWQALFFYIPLLFIIFYSFMQLNELDIVSGATVQNYIPFLKPIYFGIIARSLVLGCITALLCFCVGYPVAYFLSFRAHQFKTVFLFLLFLPFLTNFLLHVYAWFFVLERTGIINSLLLYFHIIDTPLQLLNSFAAIIAVMVYCYLPFMILPIYTILERIDRKLIEASQDLGATSIQTVIKVLLPLSMPGIQAGFFLVFIPAFGEFAIPGLIGGERYMFAGTAISQYMLGSRTLTYGAAFTVLCSISLICVSGLIYMLGRRYLKW